MSGWRRMTPVPEHGASSRMRSNGRPSHQSRGFAASRAARARQVEPRQGAPEIRDAPRVVVERDDLDGAGAAFEDVRRLSSGRRAGVEHPAPSRCVEERRGELGGLVLHRHEPFAEPRDAVDVARRVQGHPLRGVAGRAGPDPGVRQVVEVSPARGSARVDPEGHRRPFQVGAGDGLPLRRPGPFQRLEKPAGVGQPGRRGEVDVEYRVALGREAPQRGVHESGRPRLAERPGEIHRRADRRVGRNPGESELVEPDEDEGADVGVARRARRDMSEPRIQTLQMAQGSERELPRERPVARVEPRVERPPPARSERASVRSTPVTSA